MDKLYKPKHFYALITYMTVLAMFFAFSYIISQDNQKDSNNNSIKDSSNNSIKDSSDNPIKDLSNNPIKVLIASLLVTGGVYTLLSNILYFLLKNFRLTKSLLLGNFFLDGIWVGFSEEKNKVNFIVEKIEHSLDGKILITGKSYELSDNGNLFLSSFWQSTDARIDFQTNRLEYTYTNHNILETDPVKEYRGFAAFGFAAYKNKNNDFLNKSGQSFPLLKSFSMDGIIRDFNPEEDVLYSTEIKITDSTVYDLDYFKSYAPKFWEHRKGEVYSEYRNRNKN